MRLWFSGKCWNCLMHKSLDHMLVNMSESSFFILIQSKFNGKKRIYIHLVCKIVQSCLMLCLQETITLIICITLVDEPIWTDQENMLNNYQLDLNLCQWYKPLGYLIIYNINVYATNCTLCSSCLNDAVKLSHVNV